MGINGLMYVCSPVPGCAFAQEEPALCVAGEHFDCLILTPTFGQRGTRVSEAGFPPQLEWGVVKVLFLCLTLYLLEDAGGA